MTLFDVKAWITVEASDERDAESIVERWLFAVPVHRGIRDAAVEGEGSTYKKDPDG